MLLFVYVHAYVEVCQTHVFYAGTMCGHCLTLCGCGAGTGIKLHEMCGAVRVKHELVWLPAGTRNKYTAGVGIIFAVQGGCGHEIFTRAGP